MYGMVYITWNLVSEAEFDTKTCQGYRYMHGMLQQIRSIFLNYPNKIHMVS